MTTEFPKAIEPLSQAEPAQCKRILHVAVSAEAFNYAKAQAYLSGLSWQAFVEQLLLRSGAACEESK